MLAPDLSPLETWLCSQGHRSTEPDFCSECGLKLACAPAPEPEPKLELKLENTRLTCPGCGDLHTLDWGDFCEGCGHNFVLKTSDDVGQTAVRPEEACASESQGAVVDEWADQPVARTISQAVARTISQAIAQAVAQTKTNDRPKGTGQWSIAITIDPSLWDAAVSPAPPERPPEFVLLDHLGEGDRPLLIGRTSQNQALFPDIALDFDNAVSQCHAFLQLQADQSLSLRDLNSSNGTTLNGQALIPLQNYPLRSGDRAHLGHWTCLTVTLR